MKRSYLFFCFFLLWESARGFGVWNGQLAQNWQRSEEKTMQDPPSLSSEQQASSVADGVQSIERGATYSEGSSNVPTRHVRLKPNGLGVSSYGDEFNATDAQSAGRQSSSTQGFHSTRPSKPFILSSPRRLIPSSHVGMPTRDSPLPQQDGFGINLSDYSSGFASGRPSSQMPPQNPPTQYVPAFQTQASNVAPSQSLDSESLPSQQDNNVLQSTWSRVLSIHSASKPTFQSWMPNLVPPSNGFISNTFPFQLDRIGDGYSNVLFSARVDSQRSPQGLQTQYDPPLQIQESRHVASFQNSGSTSLPLQQAGYSEKSETDRLEVQNMPFGIEAPSQSLGSAPAPLQPEGYGIPSRWSSSQVDSFPSASRPALQTQPSDFVAPSRTVGSAPVPSQQEDNRAQSASEVQRILLTSWPISQAQSSNLLTPSQISGSAPVPSQQEGYDIPRWSAPQVQGIFSATSQPSNFVPPSQSLGSAPVPAQQVQRIPLVAAQPSNILAPSQSLGSASVQSQQDRDGFPSRWSTPQVQGIHSASQPLQNQPSGFVPQPSNLLAPSQSLGSAPLPPWQDDHGIPSRWSSSQVQGIPSASRPVLQTQLSDFVHPSQRVGSAPVPAQQVQRIPLVAQHSSQTQSLGSAPAPSQQDGFDIPSRWSTPQMQGLPSASQLALQNQPSGFMPLSQGAGSAPVLAQQDRDGFQSRWPAAEIKSIFLNRPRLQNQVSNQDIVASREHLSGASLPSQHNRYGPQSSFFTLREQNIPSAAGPALNRMDPSQSFLNALRLSAQDGYSAQPRWPERVPSASQPPQYGPVFQTQSSSRPVPSSWGLSNQYTSQYTSQGSQSQNAPANQAQLSGASSLQSQDVPLPRLDGLNQVPPVQTQSMYKPVFPSQERTSVFSSSQTQVRAEPSERVLCFKVSSAALSDALQSNNPVIQPQSLESLLYNPAASNSLPSSSQRQSAPALTAAQTQSGVQTPAVVYRSRFLPSTQKPANSTASVAQSVSSSSAQTSAEHLASDLSKKIPNDSWTELTERDLD